MHYKRYKSILSPHGGMNVYRGCQHGCIYCDSRSKCYRIAHNFEDIEVKADAPDILESELKARRGRCVISTGGMSDPYIPLEKELLHTRRCLEVIDKYGFGLAIQTKSDLILRDMELLRSIHEKSKCVVEMTLTTFDEELCKIIEPNVCTTRERARVLRAFRDAGIPTVVWLCPVLPFINDTEENLDGILRYCADAGVWGVLSFGLGLTLREGDREYYYQKLDEHFPGLSRKYHQKYGYSYEIRSDNSTRLEQRFTDTCARYSMESDGRRIFAFLREYRDRNEQLSLF